MTQAEGLSARGATRRPHPGVRRDHSALWQALADMGGEHPRVRGDHGPCRKV